MHQELGLNPRNALENEATDWKKSADSGGRQTWVQMWDGHLLTRPEPMS